MHPEVQRAAVTKALRKRAVLLSVSFGFDRAARLEVASMILGTPVRSFSDLDDRALRKLIFGLEAALLVVEAVRQSTIEQRRRAASGR